MLEVKEDEEEISESGNMEQGEEITYIERRPKSFSFSINLQMVVE